MIPRPASWLSVAIFLFWNAACAPLPVTFHVFDAETDKPIKGASVSAVYEDIWIGYLATIPVSPTEGVTDSNGKVLLPMNDPSIGIDIGKEGYLPYWGNGLQSEIPRWPFTSATVHLYSGPAPKVEVILPDGYRGLLQIREHRPNLVATHGERRFQFHLTPGHVVDLTGVPHGTTIASRRPTFSMKAALK